MNATAPERGTSKSVTPTPPKRQASAGRVKASLQAIREMKSRWFVTHHNVRNETSNPMATETAVLIKSLESFMRSDARGSRKKG